MNYYEYDKENIAKSIKKAISEKADPSAVSYLLNERNKKISEGGAELLQYKNDSISQEAKAYIDKYKASDVQSIYDVQKDMAAQNLYNASQRAAQNYNSGEGKIASQYSDARKAMYSAYKRSLLSGEEGLAAAGLGRGAGKAASSGFGESSRLAANIAYQNNVYNSYKNQANDLSELSKEYSDSIYNAQDAYNSAIAAANADKIKNEKDEREYLKDLDKIRNEENHYQIEMQEKADKEVYDRAIEKFKLRGVVDDDYTAQILGIPVGTTTADYEKILFDNQLNMMKFESSEEQRAFKNSLLEREFNTKYEMEEFERAYDLFKGVGSVLNDDMAQILKIPVGTRYWQYVIGAQNAQTSAYKAHK